MRMNFLAIRPATSDAKSASQAMAGSPAMQRLALHRARRIVGTFDGEDDDESPEYDDEYMNEDMSEDEMLDYFDELLLGDFAWQDIIPEEWESMYEWYMETIYGT